MPKLYESAEGTFYTRAVIEGRIVTLQIAEEGVDWLLENGCGFNEEIDHTHYWHSIQQGWLGTKGQVDGGAEILLPVNPLYEDSGNLALDAAPESIEEPLTVPCPTAASFVPLFRLDKGRSVYYTVLHVENSSDSWLQVPMIIKHRGAQELIRLGAVIDEELTEFALQLIVARRWCYFDAYRFPM